MLARDHECHLAGQVVGFGVRALEHADGASGQADRVTAGGRQRRGVDAAPVVQLQCAEQCGKDDAALGEGR